MKIKPAKKVRGIQPFALVLFAVLISSCNGTSDLAVYTGTDRDFSTIGIQNPYGAGIVFRGSENSGAVAYVAKGDTVWLKGEIEKSRHDLSTTYAWEHDEGKIILDVKEANGNLEFEFKVENEAIKPEAWLLNLEAGKDEYFTGIFERVVDGRQDESWREGITTGLNLRGERMDVKLKPTVSAYAPFFISSENYGFSVHGTWPGVIDFCRSNPELVQIAFEGPSFAFTLISDETPAAIVQQHALQSGPPLVPPKWAFGPWRWRDEHVHRTKYYDGSKVHAPYNSEVAEDILLMEAYGIPCTAYWIDRPWAIGDRGFSDYMVDYERLPNFEAMIPWLDSKGIATMLWIGPWVMGDMAQTAEERNYHLVSKKWIGDGQVLMDFSNPEACTWWGENGPAKLARMGVKGYKLDRADGEKLVDSLHLIAASGKTYRENFNDYPRQYVKATYEAVQPILGDDMLLFPRAQYTGSSRYGALWAGDTGNSDEGLRSALIGMLRCSVMGYPFWGSDTGGYPKRIEREVTLRWLGFSCFSPLMEVGPTNNLGFWGMNYEPSFDHELLAAWRFYAQLRMHLVDYLHAHAVMTGKTGMPLARPLFLEYSDQSAAWETWTTYKLGDDLLVSLIWEEGKIKQDVYLPAGENWINLWSGQEHAGGQWLEVTIAPHQISVFQKKGSSLQLPDLESLYNESFEATSVRHDMNELEKKEGWK
jgi:alpha-glucosidase (family GH31 glycosyl hydrolase)